MNYIFLKKSTKFCFKFFKCFLYSIIFFNDFKILLFFYLILNFCNLIGNPSVLFLFNVANSNSLKVSIFFKKLLFFLSINSFLKHEEKVLKSSKKSKKYLSLFFVLFFNKIKHIRNIVYKQNLFPLNNKFILMFNLINISNTSYSVFLNLLKKSNFVLNLTIINIFCTHFFSGILLKKLKSIKKRILKKNIKILNNQLQTIF